MFKSNYGIPVQWKNASAPGHGQAAVEQHEKKNGSHSCHGIQMTQTPCGCRNDNRYFATIGNFSYVNCISCTTKVFCCRHCRRRRRRSFPHSIALSLGCRRAFACVRHPAHSVLCICVDGCRLSCVRGPMHIVHVNTQSWRRATSTKKIIIMYIIIAYLYESVLCRTRPQAASHSQLLLPMVTVAHFFHPFFGRGTHSHTRNIQPNVCVAARLSLIRTA